MNSYLAESGTGVQHDSLVLRGTNEQIYNSIRDYRGWRRGSGGLFITSGPTENVMEISVPITKNHSAAGRALKIFLERNSDVQLIFDDRYNPSTRELYDMLSDTDGAANFENGRLTAVKRYIKRVDVTGKIDGGTRHIAAAYASTQGLMSHVLSEETGGITVFEEGKPIVIDPYLNREGNLTRGTEYGDFGTCIGSGSATLRERGRVYRRVPYYLFRGGDGKIHRIYAVVVEKQMSNPTCPIVLCEPLKL